MRTETFEVIKALEQYKDNPMAQHFVDFIRLSPDKDEAADEVRQLMVNTATQAVGLVQDMGLVAHDAFYPEQAKRVIDAARRMCEHISFEGSAMSVRLAYEDTLDLAELVTAVKQYEEKVLELP